MKNSNIPQVENMRNTRGNLVSNQFHIITKEGSFFKSYSSIIAFKPANNGVVQLDREKWDYSKTTGIYRNQFLGETIVETRKKIKSGEYILTDLN